ncbi:hypothetical protein FIM05_01515 [SAR202 cluster bacterium AD-802-K11_MRT_200m]|nr:hypothetical protein [SAR202 cluster bacterium AD-802-K11_MRT_200m]
MEDENPFGDDWYTTIGKWFKRHFGFLDWEFLRGFSVAVWCLTALSIFSPPFYQRFMSESTIEFLEFVAKIFALVIMWYGGKYLLRYRNIRVPDGRIGRDLMGQGLEKAEYNFFHRRCNEKVYFYAYCFVCYPDTGLEPDEPTPREAWGYHLEYESLED